MPSRGKFLNYGGCAALSGPNNLATIVATLCVKQLPLSTRVLQLTVFLEGSVKPNDYSRTWLACTSELCVLPPGSQPLVIYSPAVPEVSWFKIRVFTVEETGKYKTAARITRVIARAVSWGYWCFTVTGFPAWCQTASGSEAANGRSVSDMLGPPVEREDVPVAWWSQRIS